MNGSLMSVVKEWTKERGQHICYIFNKKKYIETVVSYIISGIKNEELVLLVENERNILLIEKEIKKQLSKAQLANVHFINNFDFYWYNGNFHPQTISLYFSQIIDPFLSTGKFVRTWAHVEWDDEKEVNEKIEEFEKLADSLVNKKKILSVCAYDSNKIPDRWVRILIECHNVTVTDEE